MKKIKNIYGLIIKCILIIALVMLPTKAYATEDLIVEDSYITNILDSLVGEAGDDNEYDDEYDDEYEDYEYTDDEESYNYTEDDEENYTESSEEYSEETSNDTEEDNEETVGTSYTEEDDDESEISNAVEDVDDEEYVVERAYSASQSVRYQSIEEDTDDEAEKELPTTGLRRNHIELIILVVGINAFIIYKKYKNIGF